MKLVSVTLLGDGREDSIRSTVESVVDLVDEFILIDTRKLEDNSVRICSQVREGHVFRFEWTGSFSDARNFALKVAAERGADWALMIDSDETLHDDNQHGGIRARLDGAMEDVQHFTLRSHDGVYQQPRFFRCPAQGAFVGPTHEEYRPSLPAYVLEGVTFDTPPKTTEQAIKSAERDLPLLERWTEEHPDDTRFWYYLGATQATLGNYLDAIDSFESRAYSGLGEESAWAKFRAAICYAQLGQWHRSLVTATEGLVLHAGLPELPWIAGVACLELKRWEQALVWGTLAVALGKLQVGRVGQKSLVAHYEGPYEVIKAAHQALGNIPSAHSAEVSGIIARKYRENR